MPTPFSAAACRAGRALLDLSQAELARRAGVSRLTVIGFEDGSRRPMPANLRALGAALEAAGAEFLHGGARLRGKPDVAHASSPPAGDQRLASVLRKLQRCSRRLRRMGVRHAVVFGSIVRGEAGPGSDVDIAIDVDKSRVRDLLDVAGIVGEIESVLGPKVDVAQLRQLRPEVARAVAREGVRAF